MTKPHIKIEIIRMPNRFLIMGNYRYEGEQWNAGEHILVKNYNKEIAKTISSIVSKLIDRFSSEKEQKKGELISVMENADLSVSMVGING